MGCPPPTHTPFPTSNFWNIKGFQLGEMCEKLSDGGEEGRGEDRGDLQVIIFSVQLM